MPCDERLRDLGLFSLEKRQFWDLQGCHQKDKARPFTVIQGGKMRGNDYKSKWGRFQLDIQK